MSKCRVCNNELEIIMADLGMSPLANSYMKEENLNKVEAFFPLKTYVCSQCFLVQLEKYESPENIFSDYAYFSSVSTSWLEHAKNYSEEMRVMLSLEQNNKVVEIASNDGYLLKNFVEKGIPVLGIEPAANVAKVALENGVDTVVDFFSEKLAKQLIMEKNQADLIVANNVLAHVPDIVDFVKGIKVLLKKSGIVTIEFPHLLNLIEENQYDTIYHEHFSYLSLTTVKTLFEKLGLEIFNVNELPTHGGSLRIFAKHKGNLSFKVMKNVTIILEKEEKYGIKDISTYKQFAEKVKKNKRDILSLLIQLKEQGNSIVGYGAPAKGNTLLNYCGIQNDFLDYTVDKSEYKQGLFLPGTHLKIEHPSKLIETKPKYIFILPWNLKLEIIEELKQLNTWGAKYIIAIPNVEVIS